MYKTENLTLNDFVIESKIGKGSYGSVYKCHRKATKEPVAIKKIEISQKDRAQFRATLEEIRVLISFEHQNLVSYKTSFQHGDNICIVTEYVGGGTLQEEV